MAHQLSMAALAPHLSSDSLGATEMLCHHCLGLPSIHLVGSGAFNQSIIFQLPTTGHTQFHK
jgi:hypothetical protein